MKSGRQLEAFRHRPLEGEEKEGRHWADGYETMTEEGEEEEEEGFA